MEQTPLKQMPLLIDVWKGNNMENYFPMKHRKTRYQREYHKSVIISDTLGDALNLNFSS